MKRSRIPKDEDRKYLAVGGVKAEMSEGLIEGRDIGSQQLFSRPPEEKKVKGEAP